MFQCYRCGKLRKSHLKCKEHSGVNPDFFDYRNLVIEICKKCCKKKGHNCKIKVK